MGPAEVRFLGSGDAFGSGGRFRTGRGPRLDYLGPAAPGGWLVARAVRRAVLEGLGRR